jgi:hypothetical protein
MTAATVRMTASAATAAVRGFAQIVHVITSDTVRTQMVTP